VSAVNGQTYAGKWGGVANNGPHGGWSERVNLDPNNVNRMLMDDWDCA
jgi:hypothetical protein